VYISTTYRAAIENALLTASIVVDCFCIAGKAEKAMSDAGIEVLMQKIPGGVLQAEMTEHLGAICRS
jgi:hypothetical protein